MKLKIIIIIGLFIILNSLLASALDYFDWRNKDGIVNLKDLSELANHWLEER